MRSKTWSRPAAAWVTLAGRVGLKRPSLYKILSKNGNPTLETLQEILKPLGLRVSVALDEAA
ncbi:MAG: helix-turn-helix domain-containing protein [Verrucomicrobiota bacterium]